MAIPYHQWKVYSRTNGMSSNKAAAYSSRSAWGGDAAGTPEHPYSAIAAAAYVARTKTWDKRYTKAQDYSRKTDLVWSGILAPPNAPAWVYDRQKLWTAVEEREDLSPKRLTAQLFRGTVIALPRELTPEQRVKLVTSYIQDHYVADGMIADINIHNPKAKDGGEQPHAHVMLTMREIGPDGFGLKRRDWNDVDFGIRDGVQHHKAFARTDGFLRQRKKAWADYVNAALEEAGFETRISHETLKAQGSPKLPNVTMGKAEHASDEYEFVRAKKAKAEDEDVRAYNAGFDIAGLVARAVTGFMEGGVVGLAENVMGQAVHAGLLPGVDKALMSIPRTVVRMVDGLVHGRPAQ